MNLTVEIPDDLVGTLNAAGGDLSRRALEALVPISSDLYRIWQEVQRAAAADSSGMT
jgi:hypothetical protein